MSSELDLFEEALNPLDSVEEILTAHNWSFNRMNADELMVQVKGKACNYRLFFIWQDDMGAMQFCCQYDMTINLNNIEAAASTLMAINEDLWVGHFDIPRDNNIPSFRHTCLLRGVTNETSYDHIEDLVDISLAQCERYYPVFRLLSAREAANDQNLSLALMETAGES